MTTVAADPATSSTAVLAGLPVEDGRDALLSEVARRLRGHFQAQGATVLVPTPDGWAVEWVARSGAASSRDRRGTAWRDCHGDAAALAPTPGSGGPLALLKLYRDTPLGAAERQALHMIARALARPLRDADAADELRAPP